MNDSSLPSLPPVSGHGSQQESSEMSDYKIVKELGRGSFGRVAQFMHLDTRKIVAIKIVREGGRKEVFIMNQLRGLDPDKCNIVKFYSSFQLHAEPCLVFESLDMNLQDFMRQRRFTPLSLNDIRTITQQMAIALTALKTVGVIHLDIKPDNIMLVDQMKQLFRLKLIDFGMSILRSDARQGDSHQPCPYRAPEIVLGLQFSEAVDMWSLGCTMAELFTNKRLFPAMCEYDLMRFMVEILGQPANHLLNAGRKSRKLFLRTREEWKLMTPMEYRRKTGKNFTDSRTYKYRSLDELTEVNLNKEDVADVEDRRQFADLLKQMLHMDPSQRITPTQVLAHPFITRIHLASGSHHSSHSEAPPPSITMQGDIETVDENPSEKRTEVDDCARGTSAEVQTDVISVQPNTKMATNLNDGSVEQETEDSAVVSTPLLRLDSAEQDSNGPQAVGNKESITELAQSAVISETPALNTTEVGDTTANPTGDSLTVLPPLVPLSSPVVDAALNDNDLVNSASAHSTPEVSKPQKKKKKKKRISRFLFWVRKRFCCCCVTEEEPEQ